MKSSMRLVTPKAFDKPAGSLTKRHHPGPLNQPPHPPAGLPPPEEPSTPGVNPEEDFLFFPAIDCTVSQKMVKLIRLYEIKSPAQVAMTRACHALFGRMHAATPKAFNTSAQGCRACEATLGFKARSAQPCQGFHAVCVQPHRRFRISAAVRIEGVLRAPAR